MKILISDPLTNKALEHLTNQGLEAIVKTDLTEEQLSAKIQNYDGLIVRSKTKVTAKVLTNPGKLKVIGRAGTGVDNIDLATATEKKIIVLNTPTANSVSVAELTIGLMLSLLRQIPKADASVKQNQWLKKYFQGGELAGKTIGIIGFGNIGKRVAERLLAFDVIILVYDPTLIKDSLITNKIKIASLKELLQKADIITIHVPLLASTKNLLSENEFNLIKKQAFLINVSRGGIVNESALISALQKGKLAGAALDVFEKEPLTDSPLQKMENVVLTPHIGASTKEAQERAGIEIAKAVALALQKKEFHNNLVNKEIL